jgi:hypothetical protein
MSRLCTQARIVGSERTVSQLSSSVNVDLTSCVGVYESASVGDGAGCTSFGSSKGPSSGIVDMKDEDLEDSVLDVLVLETSLGRVMVGGDG